MTLLLLSKFVLLLALVGLVALYIWAELPERE
jgi:hypothetical protein